MGQNTGRTIDTLNALLHGELSAAETYEQQLRRLSGLGVAPQLKECQRSHIERATKLKSRIRSLGGHPADVSRPWDSFSRLFERDAAAGVDSRVAISALQEVEVQSVRMYLADLEDTRALDAVARAFVARELLPEQRRTHELVTMGRQSQN